MTGSTERRPAWIRQLASTIIISSRASRMMRSFRGAGASSRTRRSRTRPMAVFVRSPHAHARITIDRCRAARTAKGVVAILTHKEVEAAGVGSTVAASAARRPQRRKADGTVPSGPRGRARDACRATGGAGRRREHCARAGRRRAGRRRIRGNGFRYRGSRRSLRRARRSSSRKRRAMSRSTGQPSDDGTNAREVEAIFSGAAHVARSTAVNQRLVVASMEPRGATALVRRPNDHYTLRSCSQGAGPQREQLIAMMGWPKEKLRVITEDVGGAFGLKTSGYPEYPACWSPRSSPAGRSPGWRRARNPSCPTSRRAIR